MCTAIKQDIFTVQRNDNNIKILTVMVKKQPIENRLFKNSVFIAYVCKSFSFLSSSTLKNAIRWEMASKTYYSVTSVMRIILGP